MVGLGYYYADDTYDYISFLPTDIQTSILTLNDCLTDIPLWMQSSTVMLNADKIDLIIIGAKQIRNEIVDYFPVKIFGKDADTVRNLGIVSDRHICFHQSILQLYLCKSCFFIIFPSNHASFFSNC